MRRVSARLIVVALSLALSACGSGASKGAAPSPAEDPRAQVIRAWADTLRRGDVEGASRLFALPAIVANGTPRIKLGTRDEVRVFNASLPCGARLLSTVRDGGRLIAEFQLTERPGGACGRGSGALAHTAFVIDGGRIVEWIRVERGGGGEGSRSV